MSEIKSMVEQSVNRLLSTVFTLPELARFDSEGLSQKAWTECTGIGLDRALLSEADGGIAGIPEDVFSVSYAVGFYAAGVPLGETMVALWLLSRAGISPPEGIGVLLDDSALNSRLEFSSDQQRVHGQVNAVPWAASADWAVAAQHDGSTWKIHLLMLRDNTVTMVPRPNIAAEPGADLTLNNARVLASRVINGPEMNPVRLAGALIRSAQICGALERALELSVEYAKQRHQFGKPIGQNQVLQQMLALVAGHVAAARVSALTAWSGEATSEFDISVAKIRGGEAASVTANMVHQIHGAIGFTHEYPLGFFTRRLWSWRNEFGGGEWWSEQLGRQAIRAGPENFWPSLVRRRWALEPSSNA